MKTDEMAAEEFYDKWQADGMPPMHVKRIFLAGCKYKTEQLAKPVFIKLDETTETMVKANAAVENMKMFQKDIITLRGKTHELMLENRDLRYKARDYDEHLKIINAQAERLKAAEGLIEHIRMSLEEPTVSGHPYVQKVLIEIEKFRKGER